MGALGYYRAPAPAHVDPLSEESLSLWETSLQITRGELMAAIKLYGTSVRDIRRGLVEEKRERAA